MSFLELQNITKIYPNGTKAVNETSLNIDTGEFVVFVGPSGCGKSTLLRMIAGLEDITSGEISLDGNIINNIDPSERDVAMVFQNYALYPHMSVFNNMSYGLKNRGISKDEINNKVNDVARLLEIDQLLTRKPSMLSGGQRQRVAMGRAIVRNPKIFLFDEPLSNLDAKLRVEMRREIKKLHQQLKTTVVYVTHDQTEAMSLGTNIAIMNHGVIQQNDTPENIYNKPSNTFVADFIGSPSMNLIKGNLKESSNKVSFITHGSNIEIPINGYDFKEKSNLDNKEVFFGIRPEHIFFKKSNEEDFEINLRADLSEYIGHEQIMTFNFENQEVLAKFPSTVKIDLSKNTKLFFDLTQISLFDAKTEERI